MGKQRKNDFMVENRGKRVKTVCQLLHTLNVGGAEILAERLGRNLREASWRCLFFCLDEEGSGAQRLREDGFEVKTLGRKPGWDFACMRKMARWWAEEQIEVVQAHQYTPFFYAMNARGFFGKKPPILFTEHGRFFPDLPNWKHRLFNRWMVRKEDRLVAVSESVKRALVVNEGLPDERIEVIYNGVQKPWVAEAEKSRLRETFGLAKRPVILMAARLDTIKDHPTAIRAMRELLWREGWKERPLEEQPLMVFAGGGPQYDFLRAMIDHEGLGNHVRLLGERSDVAVWMALASVFLLTSVSEGIPLTILEAMASQVPVVATAVGGIPEILKQNQTARLVSAGDIQGIADALEHLLKNPKEGEQIAHAAYTLYQERLTEMEMIRQYQEILENMRTRAYKKEKDCLL